jgi:hypothetical protein
VEKGARAMSLRTSLEVALRPLAARMGAPVREHEVLRIAATMHCKNIEKSVSEVRRQVLAWAQNRCGGRLPKEAWDFETFEYFAGGRNSLGIRLKADDADIWGIRTEDPDKVVPGRIWTTEVIIGAINGQEPRFSVRQLVNTAEPNLQIEPHSPGLVRQIVDVCSSTVGSADLHEDPWILHHELEAAELVERLLDPNRSLPLIVLTGDERAEHADTPLLDAGGLARALLGLAHIAVVPAKLTWMLSKSLGQMRSVFHGGVRYYQPGLTASADPFRHRLFTSNQLSSPSERTRAESSLRRMAADDSLRRNRLGRDVLAFAEVRNSSLSARQMQLANEGASEAEQLTAARSTINALEQLLKEGRAMQDYFDAEAQKEKERAEIAEHQLRAANFYVQQLQARVRSKGTDSEETVVLPVEWDEFSDWCEASFIGKVALASAARRNTKNPEFENIALAARCVRWLATTYRDGRIDGADGDFRDATIEEGVHIAPSGGDEFEIDWQGRRHAVDWHVKNGGNTRDPRRCLRIYYFWEAETQQVVLADMPHHRRSVTT